MNYIRRAVEVWEQKERELREKERELREATMATNLEDMIPGLVRVSTTDFLADKPLPENAWLDVVVWDIPNTMIGAVKAAHARGVKAMTFFWPVCSETGRHDDVIKTCKNLGLIIVRADQNMRRNIYWRPVDETVSANPK